MVFAMIVNILGVKIWINFLENQSSESEYLVRKFEIPTISVIIDTILKYGEVILVYNVRIGPKYWYLCNINNN